MSMAASSTRLFLFFILFSSEMYYLTGFVHEEGPFPFHKTLLIQDEIDPPSTILPTTPPDTLTPTIVTVPATNPVTVSPVNPAANPVTNPANSPLPVTNPVVQPVTNPVATYPPPSLNPPATTNAPAGPGQSWCVAKTGSVETAIQAALDYACGIGGADCSQIQQTGSCYNPNTLQNHASYAFNSYYQKKPVPTSCDFGGTAMIVSTNPSSGSCIYPSSSSSSPISPSTSTPMAMPTPTPIPTQTPTQTPVTTAPPTSGGTVTGPGTPPVVNMSDPASSIPTVYGSSIPPQFNTSTPSMSPDFKPFLGCIIFIASLVTGKIAVDL